MAYAIQNSEGRWGVGNVKLTDSYIEIEKDQEGVIIAPEGLVEQIAKDALLDTLNIWKANRQTAVDNIEITYNGVIYQGDEISQTRMARAITALTSDTISVYWVAKDNSIQELKKSDLQSILFLAGQKQSEIWTEGRPNV